VSKVPFSYMARGLKPVMFLIVLTMLINLFLTPGEIIWTLGPLKVAREGISRAAFMAIRLTPAISAGTPMPPW
jgi:energy-coupling factor transport system permease protein